MNRKAKYVLPALLVLFGILAYAANITLTIPRSTEGAGSILTWGESGTYNFTVGGIDPSEATACASGTTECHWHLRLLLNGVNKWSGDLFEQVGYIGKWNHISVTVNDLGGGSAEVVFTATPPADSFSGAPYTTYTWHGIEYQTWLMSAIFTKKDSIQQIAGSVAIVVSEDMEKINEFLTDTSAPVEGGVDHLNYTLNDANLGVLTLTNEIYDYACTTYKDGWDSFKSTDLQQAKDSLEDLDALRESQASNYAGYAVQDAIDIQDKINRAADDYSVAVDRYINDFSACPCVEGC